jgi:hypothetical protein
MRDSAPPAQGRRSKRPSSPETAHSAKADLYTMVKKDFLSEDETSYSKKDHKDYLSLLDENIIYHIISHLDKVNQKSFIGLELNVDIQRIFRYMFNLRFPEDYLIINSVVFDSKSGIDFNWIDAYIIMSGVNKKSYKEGQYLRLLPTYGTKAYIKKMYPKLYDKVRYVVDDKLFEELYKEFRYIKSETILRYYILNGTFPENYKISYDDILKQIPGFLPILLTILVNDDSIEFVSHDDYFKIIHEIIFIDSAALNYFSRDKLLEIVDMIDRYDLDDKYKFELTIIRKYLYDNSV